MAYDEKLAERIREVIGDPPRLIEKKMFGGVGFMVQGNMACGVHREKLIVRVGVEAHAEALQQPFALPFDITGKPMNGWIMVSPEGIASRKVLQEWVEQGVQFALTLPEKHRSLPPGKPPVNGPVEGRPELA